MLPEIEAYLAELRRLHADVLATLEGVEPDGLNWKPLADDTNSLYAIAAHAIGSEHGWIAERLAGRQKTRDREAEFTRSGSDLQALKREYAATERETAEILSALTAADLAATRPDAKRGEVTLRWMILHVIGHFYEHLGALELTRQLWLAHRRAENSK